MVYVCRVCLDASVPLVDIFAEICDRRLDLFKITPAYVISQLSPEHSVVRGDSMPQFICLSCIHGGLTAYRYKLLLDKGFANYRQLCLNNTKQKRSRLVLSSVSENEETYTIEYSDEEEDRMRANERHEIEAELENAILPETADEVVEHFVHDEAHICVNLQKEVSVENVDIDLEEGTRTLRNFADEQTRLQIGVSMDTHDIKKMEQIPELAQVAEAEAHMHNNLQPNTANKRQSPHCGKLLFLCDVCGKAFMTEFQLNRHETSHKNKQTSEINTKPLGIKNTINRSPSPKKKNPESEESDLEMLSSHDTSSRSRSPPLLKMLNCSDDLDTDISGHTKKTQSLSKKLNFTCQECGKIFSFKSKLDRHTLLHTGERPFQCTYCTKKFARKDQLDRHTRRKKKCNKKTDERRQEEERRKF